MVDLVVLMSVYHNDKLHFVKEAVESILNQSYKYFHFFLIFDGPVSYEIEKYIEGIKDERIRLFRLDMNSGLATALNTLLEIVLKNPEYKYIARMDADDVSILNRFEKQRNYLIEYPDISVLGCWFEEIDEEGCHISYRQPPKDHDLLKKRYFTRSPFAHSSVMFNRRLIEIAGYYPTNTVLMEDNALWGKALKNGLKFGNISDFLLKFRISRDFYKRRTGVTYGIQFLIKKSQINSSLKAPIYTYLIVLIISIIKILPHWFLKRISKENNFNIVINKWLI